MANLCKILCSFKYEISVFLRMGPLNTFVSVAGILCQPLKQSFQILKQCWDYLYQNQSISVWSKLSQQRPAESGILHMTLFAYSEYAAESRIRLLL